MRWMLLGLLALGACAGNDDIKPPQIAGITPNRATPGTSVAITGNYFCAQPEPDDPDDVDPLDCDNVGGVTFGFAPATVTVYSELMIVAEVPDLAPGAAVVHVASGGRSSNGFDFVVEP